MTIAQAGKKHPGIETDFLVSIINTYLNEDYFPEHTLKEFQATTIIKYLRQTYSHYTRVTLPVIERHFNALVSVSGNDNNLKPMRQFFDTLKESVLTLRETDEATTFSSIDIPGSHDHRNAISMTGQICEMIDDLTCMLIIHLQGNVDQNLCYAVINSLISLAADFSRNSRIRNRILLASK